MPLDEQVLGFNNLWYSDALKTAQPATLPSGAVIRLISAPYFLGTKMEAFRGRGGNDFLGGGHDIEDFIAVIDGRETLLEELKLGPKNITLYLAQAAKELLAEPRFLDALPGYLPGDAISQQRVPVVVKRLRMMMGLKSLCN